MGLVDVLRRTFLLLLELVFLLLVVFVFEMKLFSFWICGGFLFLLVEGIGLLLGRNPHHHHHLPATITTTIVIIVIAMDYVGVTAIIADVVAEVIVVIFGAGLVVDLVITASTFTFLIACHTTSDLNFTAAFTATNIIITTAAAAARITTITHLTPHNPPLINITTITTTKFQPSSSSSSSFSSSQ